MTRTQKYIEREPRSDYYPKISREEVADIMSRTAWMEGMARAAKTLEDAGFYDKNDRATLDAEERGMQKGREAVALGRIAAAGRTYEQDVRDNRDDVTSTYRKSA